MIDKFHSIPAEKQERILNAAMKAFSLNGYKLANTNDIAASAGISKGLLFYYFGSKRGLYVYLYTYSIQLVTKRTRILEVASETDFFELIIHAMESKTEIMFEYPYLFSFMLKAYYEQDLEVAGDIADMTVQSSDSSIDIIMRYADRSKFRDDVSLEKAYRIVRWCSEGFMKAKQLEGHLDAKALSDEFRECLRLLKRSFYKEEWL